MLTVHDPRQRLHRPAHEFFNGALEPHAETPARLDAIVAALGETALPRDHGLGPIAAVHDGGYLGALESAHRRWREAGRAGDAVGYAWPVVRRRAVALDRVDALLGLYSADAVTPIAEGTWDAAYWSAQAALTALDAVLAGATRTAFALCRPPGHHAGRDYLGGYCYLNNAAIAAQHACAAGRRVAILDVDYHHGNGTQDIFYARGDVFFASIHADPATDFPYFWGREDERGEGEGGGANLNVVLPRGTDWPPYRRALVSALDAVGRFAPDLLVVSFGADTFEGDPISGFALRTEDYPAMGGHIATLRLPTLVVMEGGYAVDALGRNVAGFLSGFA
jgi:acetoin utilization deacetylase AcuC-like enzyme